MKRSHLLVAVGVLALAAGTTWWVVRGPSLAGIPDSFSIPVEIDGKAADPIDVALLASQSVERTYHQWKIWDLQALLDIPVGSLVETKRSDGSRAGIRLPNSGPGAPLLGFAVDDTGAIRILLVQPASQVISLPAGRTKSVAPATGIVVTSTFSASRVRENAGGGGGDRVGNSGGGRGDRTGRMGLGGRAGERDGGGGRGDGSGGGPGRVEGRGDGRGGGGGRGRGRGDGTGGGAGGGDGRDGEGRGGGGRDRAGHDGSITVVVEGDEPGTWSPEAIAGVSGRQQIPVAGGHTVNGWSLRDVAATLVGPGARILSVTGSAGELKISEADWEDGARVPVIRAGQRGGWLFEWRDSVSLALQGDPSPGLLKITVTR